MPAAAIATSKNLMNFLAAPARVASKMDWKQSSAAVLSVDIGHDCIGLAVATHPSSKQPIRTLRPLTVTHETRQGNRRVLSQACVRTMAAIVQEHQVCALLVSWPVQHEGRCGKPCGQVLHALDSLVQESNSIVTKTRPVCLWDDRHVKTYEADYFGRDPIFGAAGPKHQTEYRASQEQYQHHDCSSTVAAQVWQDFCQTHWPQMEVERIVGYDTEQQELIQDEDDEEEEEVQQERIHDDDVEQQQQQELKVAFM